MRIINSITALSGAGKTHTMIKLINESNEKYIVLAPSIRLCNQIGQDLNQAFIVHSEMENVGSSSTLLQMLIQNGAQKICSTHQSFEQMLKNESVDLTDYHLIIDEVPTAMKESMTVWDNDSADHFMGLVNIEPSDKFENFLEFTAKNADSMRKKLRKNGADVYKQKAVKNLIDNICNNAYRTLIHQDLYQRFNDNLVDDNARLDVVSLFKPEVLEGTKSCTVMSAFFDHTEFSIMMRKQGVQFQDTNIDVRYKEHNVGHRLNVKYFTERNNSKSFADTKNVDGVANVETIVKHVVDEISDEDFIYNANVVHRHLFRDEFGKAYRNAECVSTVHGINSFQKITKAVYLPAFNPNPSTMAILHYFDLTTYDIAFARNQLMAYQFLMRTALRDTDSTEEVTFYCVDEFTATFISNVFNCPKTLVQVGLANYVDGRKQNGGHPNAGRKKNTPELNVISLELHKLTRRKNPKPEVLNRISELKQQRAMIKAGN